MAPADKRGEGTARNDKRVIVTPLQQAAPVDERVFDSRISVGPLPAPVQARIDEWRPKYLTSATMLPPWVEATRQAVANAAPRNSAECNNALRWVGEYLEARFEQGLPLDDEQVWSEDNIDKFLTVAYGLAPKGTRDAVKSHLRRTHPAVGYAGTTRRRNVTTASPVEPPEQPAQPAVPPADLLREPEHGEGADEAVVGLPDRVLEVIGSYTAQRVAADRWDAVESYVRDAVTRIGPMTERHALTLMHHVTLLTAWTHHQAMPVRDDVVFDASNIETFLTQVLLSRSVEVRSVATYAANLHAARELLGLPLDVPRRQFPKAKRKEPYGEAEVAAVFAQVAALPRDERRRYVRAALNLLFGAGLLPGESGLVRPGDIRKEGLLVLVTVDGREVAVLGDYADAVVSDRNAAVAAGEEWMLGGGADRAGRFNDLMRARRSGRWAVEVDSTRARRTWALEMILPFAQMPGGLGALRQLATNPALVGMLEVLA